MKLYPSNKTGCCPADKTFETTMMVVPRGRPPRKIRDKQIHHVKEGIRFWHWSDQSGNLKHADFLPVDSQEDAQTPSIRSDDNPTHHGNV